MMNEDRRARIKRIDAEDARRKSTEGDALLICAYEDDEKARSMRFEGALTLHEFEQKAPSLARDRELIFYCA